MVFGRRKVSAASQYILAMGKSAGNLKDAAPKPKAPPVKKVSNGKKPLPSASGDMAAGKKGRASMGAVGKISCD